MAIRLPVLIAAYLAVMFVGVPGATAAPTKAFDPVLSLTGGCGTSPVDPVEDPGCPGNPGPPGGTFSFPTSVVSDSYGNIYVASRGQVAAGTQGRIDIFDSSGFFITEIVDPAGPSSMAIDTDGVLYVANAPESQQTVEERVVRYIPTVYEPATGEIAYGNPPEILIPRNFNIFIGLAVNPTNNHLFLNYEGHIIEYGSAAEENKVLEDPVAEVHDPFGGGLALDIANNRIYAADSGSVAVFELTDPHTRLLTLDGSNTPAGKFAPGPLSIAVDEGTGHVFVYNGEAKKVYEFTKEGDYVGTIEHSFQYVYGSEIFVDNGPHSPNGALNPKGRYLFVPSHPSGTGHSFAFGPPSQCAPEVESVSFADATETEAELRSTIEPCSLGTTYSFEYTTQESFEAQGFAGAVLAGAGQIPAGAAPVDVAAAAGSLSPGTLYRFRVIATNSEGSDELEGSFRTYPSSLVDGATCPNQAFSVGFSAALPDCRAYELVTPPDTNGRSPIGVGHLGSYFATREASPSGNAVSFQIEGGAFPETHEGTGSFAGDPYLSTRGPEGWSTSYVGPTALESPAVLPGSTSPDQGYSFWTMSSESGTAALEGRPTSYVRYPDGHSAPVGRGSLGIDPEAQGKLISPDGSHIIFKSANFPIPGSFHKAVQLEPNAPPTGTEAIYDRTADEVTHVVSLLPGDKTPASGQNAEYEGASLDGRGVAFSIDSTLYLRYDNEETYEIGKDLTFAGVAEGGGRIFYVAGGNLEAFDVASGKVISFSTSGNVIPVNVSADGTAAYFVSTSVLSSKANPSGAKAKAGQQNLYLSREGAISFVGTVTERDVVGDSSGNEAVEGLGLWTTAVGPSQYGGPGRLAEDPSRTTPDGSVILFESRASLTGYDTEGHTQVYRYDAGSGELTCLSCNPVGLPPTGSASLQSLTQQIGEAAPFSSFAVVANLRPDGKRAFFQSTEGLVPRDTDQLQDVYEWEAAGVGSCGLAGGCIYLISSGHSARPDYLYAVSDSGDDVFFRSSDLLVASDRNETPSLYDARVNGGFPEPAEETCEGEGCHLDIPAAPSLSTPQTGPIGGRSKACPRGKRKVRRHGKVRCVKKHRKHHRHHKSGTRKKGAGR
jgi:hypothetical protein